MKVTGDMVKMVKQDAYIQKLVEKGNDLHSLANPSQAELLFKWYQQEKNSFEVKNQNNLYEKYGEQQDFEIKNTDVEVKENKVIIAYKVDNTKK